MANRIGDPDTAEQLAPDQVWAAIQPLLSAKRPHPAAAVCRAAPSQGWPALDWGPDGAGRSLAWLLANRRLIVRYERRADILSALLHLACALICAGKLRPL